MEEDSMPTTNRSTRQNKGKKPTETNEKDQANRKKKTDVNDATTSKEVGKTHSDIKDDKRDRTSCYKHTLVC